MYICVCVCVCVCVPISYALMLSPSVSSASDDIPHSDEIRALVKDIWDLRVAKLRKGINEMVAQQESHALVGFFSLSVL